MCEKSVDKTDSSSNFWKVTPLSDEMTSAPPTPTETSPCQKTSIEIKHLGVEKVDPNCYSQQYGSSLKLHTQLPDIAKKVKQVERITLAAERESRYFMGLEGDIHALCMIDLDKEGLGEYKKYLKDKNVLNCVDQKRDRIDRAKKTRSQIIRLELGCQELESIDIYKERLNEYKQAIKPVNCNNEESKEENNKNEIKPHNDIQTALNIQANSANLTNHYPTVSNTPLNQVNTSNHNIQTNSTNPANFTNSLNVTNSTNVLNSVMTTTPAALTTAANVTTLTNVTAISNITANVNTLNSTFNPTNTTNTNTNLPLINPVNNPTPLTPFLNTPNTPALQTTCLTQTKNETLKSAAPLLSHPTNYSYNPIQNLYYLLQLNLLKNSLLQHYLQNVTLAKYITTNPNRPSATNFIMNRNFF